MLSNETYHQIRLSYPRQGLDKIVFDLRPLTWGEEMQLAAETVGMTAAQAKSFESRINLALLSLLSIHVPLGFADFPETFSQDQLVKAHQRYFGDGNPLKEQIVSDALAAYRKLINQDEFCEVFWIAARQHVIYRSELHEMHPQYDDCPRVCALREQTSDANGERYVREQKAAFCDDCTANHRWQNFVDDLKAALDDYAVDFPDAKQFSLNEILTALNTIASLAGTTDDSQIPDDWTTTTAKFVSIYRREMRRPQRIADWNERQRIEQEKQKSNLAR